LFFSLSILISILLMNQIVILFDRIVGKGLQSSVIMEVFSLSVPFIFATTVPMAVLVSTLWAFGRLSSDNEIIAMKSSGVSLLYILRPLLLASFLLTVLMIWFNNAVLPDSNYRLRSILLDISYQKPTVDIKEGVLMEDLSGYSLLVQKIDRQDSRLYDVTIYDNSTKGLPRMILANEGKMFFSEDQEDLVIRLKHGEIHQVDPENMGSYQRVAFNSQTIIIKNVGGRLKRRHHGNYRSDREMNTQMMLNEVVENRSKINSIKSDIYREMMAEVDTLFFQSLSRDYLPLIGKIHRCPIGFTSAGSRRSAKISMTYQQREKQIEALQKRNDQLMVEYYKKFSIPFASIVFILLGAPLRLNFRSGGAGTVIVLSLITFMSYYVFLTGGENLADRGLIQPFLAMWAPNIFFGALGAILLLRTARETPFLDLSVFNPIKWFRKMVNMP
jgi:lipopolysaccharide export system permease protein